MDSDKRPDPNSSQRDSLEPPDRAYSSGWHRWLVLIAVVLPALVLRLPIADHDLEHYIGPDEGEVVENVLEMMKTGDFDHRHTGYPGLHFYLLRAVFTARIGWESVQGRASTIPEMNREDFYWVARRLSLAASWLAALVVFALVSGNGTISNQKNVAARSSPAWLAAMLVAYSPLVFRESQVTNPDLVLMLFLSVSLLAVVRASEQASMVRWFLAGAACAGAIAIKYTGAIVLVPAVVGLGSSRLNGDLRTFRERSRYFGVFVLALAFTFIAVSPYTFLNLNLASEGFGRHLSYYRFAQRNAALELLRQSWLYGMGPVAMVFACCGLTMALLGGFRVRRFNNFPTHAAFLVSLVPLGVVLVFSLFSRAFPRHALILVIPLSILAAWGWHSLTETRRILRWGLVALVVGMNVTGSVRWSRAASRPTAASRAHDWALSRLPKDSRILQDQFTPRWDDAFRVHRLRVEESVFVGAYDWVFHSGYPPGVRTEALRPVIRFETDGALGSPIAVFQVPDRASLMGVTLAADTESTSFGAGERAFFGDGWSEPEPGAFDTSRLSRGMRGEAFFVLSLGRKGTDSRHLEIAWEATLAVGAAPISYTVTLNGHEQGGRLRLGPSDEPATQRILVSASDWQAGLNRLQWTFDETRRLNRRHDEVAMRLFRVTLNWKPKAP